MFFFYQFARVDAVLERLDIPQPAPFASQRATARRLAPKYDSFDNAPIGEWGVGIFLFIAIADPNSSQSSRTRLNGCHKVSLYPINRRFAFYVQMHVEQRVLLFTCDEASRPR